METRRMIDIRGSVISDVDTLAFECDYLRLKTECAAVGRKVLITLPKFLIFPKSEKTPRWKSLIAFSIAETTLFKQDLQGFTYSWFFDAYKPYERGVVESFIDFAILTEKDLVVDVPITRDNLEMSIKRMYLFFETELCGESTHLKDRKARLSYDDIMTLIDSMMDVLSKGLYR